jgi:hypothetical protein
MDIVQRVQAILVKPKEEWTRIKAEPATIAELFRSYVLILAAIPAGFLFLERVLIEKLPVYGHWSIGRALFSAGVGYVIDLATVYLFALIIEGMATTFSSTKSMVKALQLAAYSMTPIWLVGIFNIIPKFWAPSLIASFYGIYLLYLGFDVPMMETPKRKIPGYAALAIAAIIILSLVNWLVKAAFAVRAL